MPATDPRAVSPDIQADIYRRAQSGQTSRIIAKSLGVSLSTVSKWANRQPASVVAPDKKRSEFDWREWTDLAQKVQKLHHKASASQRTATVRLGDGTRPVYLLAFGDQHWGSAAIDYAQFFKMTEEIVNTPDLYVVLLGDEVEMAVKLRSVAEVCGQIFDPEKQERFLEDWLDYIAPKVAASCWGNHGEDREEKQIGVSFVKRLLSDRFVYFKGIGHLDVQVGQQTYKLALSHKFRGYSYMNPCHAGQRYMRFEGVDREVALMGHVHTPAFMSYWDGPVERCSMVSGTMKTDCTHSMRHYSLFTQAQFPVLRLSHDDHQKLPFKNLHQAFDWRSGK